MPCVPKLQVSSALTGKGLPVFKSHLKNKFYSSAFIYCKYLSCFFFRFLSMVSWLKFI